MPRHTTSHSRLTACLAVDTGFRHSLRQSAPPKSLRGRYLRTLATFELSALVQRLEFLEAFLQRTGVERLQPQLCQDLLGIRHARLPP